MCVCTCVRNARTKIRVHTAYMDAFYLDHRERFPLHTTYAPALVHISNRKQ